MSIANLGADGPFSPEIAQPILTNPDVRDRVLDSVMATVTEKGYVGVGRRGPRPPCRRSDACWSTPPP